jgi:hypothetical protein
VTSQRVDPSLFAIDHADGRVAAKPGLAQRLHRRDSRAAGRDDVLDETDELTFRVAAFEPVRRAVFLRLLADDQERSPGGQRGRNGERDCTELGAREERRLGLDLLDSGGDPRPELAKDLGTRLEAVLVEVVAGAPARTEDEVALEVGNLPDRLDQLAVVQEPAAARTSRASGRIRSASAVPSTSDTIDPSSK